MFGKVQIWCILYKEIYIFNYIVLLIVDSIASLFTIIGLLLVAIVTIAILVAKGRQKRKDDEDADVEIRSK